MEIVTTYLVYLCVSVLLTFWVARTLHKNGRRFLLDVFTGDAELADSVNHLLVVGFYLINFGFVLYTLKVGVRVLNTQTAIEVLADKLGGVTLFLGFMHFFNLYVFSRIRRRTTLSDAPLPVEPNSYLSGLTARRADPCQA